MGMDTNRNGPPPNRGLLRGSTDPNEGAWVPGGNPWILVGTVVGAKLATIVIIMALSWNAEAGGIDTHRAPWLRRTASTNSPGCSQEPKWPPAGSTSQSTTVRHRSAHDRGQRRMSFGKMETDTGTVTNGGCGSAAFCRAHSPYRRMAEAIVPVAQ